MSGAIPLLPLCVVMVWRGRTFPLLLSFDEQGTGRSWHVCYAPINFAMSVSLFVCPTVQT